MDPSQLRLVTCPQCKLKTRIGSVAWPLCGWCGYGPLAPKNVADYVPSVVQLS
jgi:hypothetical protein